MTACIVGTQTPMTLAALVAVVVTRQVMAKSSTVDVAAGAVVAT